MIRAQQISYLVSISQDLETVGDDGQELDIVPRQECNLNKYTNNVVVKVCLFREKHTVKAYKGTFFPRENNNKNAYNNNFFTKDDNNNNGTITTSLLRTTATPSFDRKQKPAKSQYVPFSEALQRGGRPSWILLGEEEDCEGL